MKHRAEPWISSQWGYNILTADSMYSICELPPRDHTPDEERMANARRIVACVNSCRGLTNEALESGAIRELLDACSIAEAQLSEVLDRNNWDNVEDNCREVLGILRQALARVRENDAASLA